MSTKAYVLLDINKGSSEAVVKVLRGKPGVVMADAVEGPPDVVIVMKAPNRERLAKLTNRALTLVEIMTEHVHLVPARGKSNRRTSPKIPS